MFYLKKIINFLVITAFLCLFITGCADKDGSGFIFKYDIPVNPKTLDPQTATGQTAALLIANMFDGLLKVDGNGGIISNIAAEYSVSEDNLIYTFILREDIFWYYDGENVPCTAHDFVFAFRRLFNPAVKSENAPLFYSIKNGENVHKSRIEFEHDPERPLEAIGVHALNDYTLIITLEAPNPLLPYLLTTTPAMPCNEELYEKTAGRYGLNEKSIPSNGAFYITKWNFDPYSSNNNIIIMRRNAKNNEAEQIFPSGLNFFIGEKDPLTHFLDGHVHSIIAEGENAEFLMLNNYPYDGFENSVWGIVFNTNRDKVFSNADLREALASGLDRNLINPNRYGWRTSENIIPPLINIGREPYRKTAGDSAVLAYNAENAKLSYEKGAKEAGYDRLSGLSVIIPDNRTAFEYMSRILQQWQTFGFYCSIRVLPDDEFESALSGGDYDIAMTKISGEFNSPDAYLSQFGKCIRSQPAPSSEYRNILTEARHSADLEAGAGLFLQAENMLLEQAVFVPVCYQTELFFYNKKSSDLLYNPFTGTVTFREAKYLK
ncbi:MAG: peptide ABC transporter substrate-binding protein [Oscillospiraceae bacterium]|nr:peptide ABC transporter substrate-binding protein [Oscillospiraceae bacterium]